MILVGVAKLLIALCKVTNLQGAGLVKIVRWVKFAGCRVDCKIAVCGISDKIVGWVNKLFILELLKILHTRFYVHVVAFLQIRITGYV